MKMRVNGKRAVASIGGARRRGGAAYFLEKIRLCGSANGRRRRRWRLLLSNVLSVGACYIQYSILLKGADACVASTWLFRIEIFVIKIIMMIQVGEGRGPGVKNRGDIRRDMAALCLFGNSVK